MSLLVLNTNKSRTFTHVLQAKKTFSAFRSRWMMLLSCCRSKNKCLKFFTSVLMNKVLQCVGETVGALTKWIHRALRSLTVSLIAASNCGSWCCGLTHWITWAVIYKWNWFTWGVIFKINGSELIESFTIKFTCFFITKHHTVDSELPKYSDKIPGKSGNNVK